MANDRDRLRLRRLGDPLVVAVAASLPWSTSATAILVVLWALTIIPTVTWGELRRELATPAGGLPVLLVALGVLGMSWADVSLAERWDGVDSFFKLLAIPLLFIQFRSSERGTWVVGGYVLSCVVLLLLSYGMMLWPHPVHVFSGETGVPVKNAPSQSGEFVTCIFGLLLLARDALQRKQWPWLGVLLAVMLAMLANVLFVAVSRTALVVMLALLVLFAVRMLRARGIALLLACAVTIGLVAWFTSPYLRWRVEQVWTDAQKYEASEQANSSGERIEFARKSLMFIRQAPFIGHGTGSIRHLFAQTVAGQTGAAAVPSANPHNQTFAVAIQLGLLGAAVLWAMWLAHLLLFRGNGLAEWIGLVVVVQNIVGSLFNSHLFDFLQGWTYVFGVGVAGGMVLQRLLPADREQAPTKS